MAREQFQTLSEPMYYVLLSLTEPCCGVDVMERVSKLSNNRVAVGPGTLYTLLARFQETGVILEIPLAGRKRTYMITDYGKSLLTAEYNRLLTMYHDGKSVLEKGEDVS